MPTTPIFLGPWSGIDNVHEADARTFQPPGELEKRVPTLVQASNVDFNDDGWPSTRGALVQKVALTDGLAVFSGAGLLLAQDEGTIKLVDPSDWSTTDLVTGLATDQRVEFHTHAGQVFWTNGTVTGRILADGTALNWGCSVPTCTLAAVAGALRAGRYLVACTFVDAAGVEHGAGKASVIELAVPTAIQVTIPSFDSSAVSVRVYATRTNGTELFLIGESLVGSFPVTIADVEISERPLRTQFLTPPVAGDGLFSYRGSLVLFADNFLFPSYGLNTHLYEITEVQEARPTTVLAGAGLDTGFWTVCEGGAFWTVGDTPENWQTWQRDSRVYAAGSLVLSGSLLPKLRTSDDVVLFVSSRGLVAGLSSGTLVPLHEDQLSIDVLGKQASIVYRKLDNGLLPAMRQVLFSLQ